MSCACTSTSYMRGIKQCTIIWSPRFKISSFKWNFRQCLSLISLFPKFTYQYTFVSYDLALDLDPFQGINQAFSRMLHERNRIMYNYMVANLQNFKLQMQYMVNKFHERNLLHLIKLHDRNQIMYNYMVAPLQKSQASNATSGSACLWYLSFQGYLPEYFRLIWTGSWSWSFPRNHSNIQLTF